MKDNKLIPGQYSGKKSEDIYELGVRFQDCQKLYPSSEDPSYTNNCDRTLESERTTNLKLHHTDSARTFMTSKVLVKTTRDCDKMVDALIEEFIQHKIQVSILVYRRNLHMRATEATSQFLSRIRLVLIYLVTKDFRDSVEKMERPRACQRVRAEPE